MIYLVVAQLILLSGLYIRQSQYKESELICLLPQETEDWIDHFIE